METLVKFDLTDKLYYITADNASNNPKLIECLAQQLLREFGVVMDPDEQLIPCLAHIINLAVGSFLKNLKVIHEDKDETGDEEQMRGHLEVQSDQDFAITMIKVREITKVPCFGWVLIATSDSLESVVKSTTSGAICEGMQRNSYALPPPHI